MKATLSNVGVCEGTAFVRMIKYDSLIHQVDVAHLHKYCKPVVYAPTTHIQLIHTFRCAARR